MAAIELIDYIETGKITNSVNLPNCELAKTADHLVCVIHKNIPSMFTQITAIVSEAGGNIENVVSKSKKDWAYTMLDVTGDVKESCATIEHIDGVTKVRVL